LERWLGGGGLQPKAGLFEEEGVSAKAVAEVVSRRVCVAVGSEHRTVLNQGNEGNQEFCSAAAKSFSTIFNMGRSWHIRRQTKNLWKDFWTKSGQRYLKFHGQARGENGFVFRVL
jgi:hypothetical protein